MDKATLTRWVLESDAGEGEFTAEELQGMVAARALRKRTVRQWREALVIREDSDPLTETEYLMTALSGVSDLLYQSEQSLLEMRQRLTRIELFMAATIPGYDPATRALAEKILVEPERNGHAQEHRAEGRAPRAGSRRIGGGAYRDQPSD